MDDVDGDNNGLLDVEVTVDDGRSVCIALAGELDISNVDLLEQKIVSVLEQRPTRLIIDASDLRFADSSGIALWVRLASSVDQFELRNPSPLLRRVLATMGLSAKMRVSSEIGATYSREFPADRRSVSAARRFASEHLGNSPVDVREAVELMVSELATNCIRHVDSEFEVTVHRTEDAIRVEVSDPGTGTPSMRSPSPDEPTGRGLRIVDMLSDAWGVVPADTTGKTVWFTLSLAPAVNAATR